MNKEQRQAKKTVKKNAKRKAFVKTRDAKNRIEQKKRTAVKNAYRAERIIKRYKREQNLKKAG